MRLDEALSDMQTIRSHLSRVQVATCYRSATAAASGFVALFAAFFQPAVQPVAMAMFRPAVLNSQQAVFFLVYWSLVALISVLIFATEMSWRYWKVSTSHQRRHTIQSLAEFLPSIAAGVVLGLLLVLQQPEHAALLPGLWSVLFGLGILSTLKRLPAHSVWIAVHYLVAGFFCIKFATGNQSLAPWTMAVTFGAGQLLAALVLRRTQPTQT